MPLEITANDNVGQQSKVSMDIRWTVHLHRTSWKC